MLSTPQPIKVPSDREGGGDVPERLAQEHLHQLVLLHLALAYGTDHDLHPMERHAIVRLIHRWMPDADRSQVEGTVDAAFTAIRSAPPESPEALAEELAPVLSPQLRRRVLADLGRVAKADGWLSLREASLIARVRQIWEERAVPSPKVKHEEQGGE